MHPRSNYAVVGLDFYPKMVASFEYKQEELKK